MGLFSRKKKEEFVSPMTGTLLPIEQCPDPVSGTIGTAFPTGHAYGINTDDGKEILIHIGMDTVALNGQGFDVKVKQGDTVKQGDLLVKVDVEYLKAQGKSVVSPVIFTSGEKVELQKTGAVQNGENGIVKIG